MNNAAPFPVTVHGETVEVRPLTVRERMKLQNVLVENARGRALETARDCELKGREAAEFVSRAAEEAGKVSSLVMSCFTIEGALAVLYLACKSKEDAELVASIEPGEVGVVAARALNVTVGRADEGSSGNP